MTKSLANVNKQMVLEKTKHQKACFSTSHDDACVACAHGRMPRMPLECQ